MVGGPSRPLRLGVVAYLNAVPTVHGLEGDPDFVILREVPSRVADRLHAGEIDLGLIPSLEYAAGDYAIVPGIAIASRGAVRSVNLYHRVPLGDVRRVALDTSSRTSAGLAKVLLPGLVGREPEWAPGRPDVDGMLAEADAALVIGDPALAYRGDAARLDLGELWTRETGLPFVWAFWAGPRGPVEAHHVERLQLALLDGLAAIPAIAAAYNGDAGANEAYLRHHIAYALGEAERRGLLEYYRRAHETGLLPRVPELRFHGDP